MSPVTEQLLQSALALPEEKRLQFAEALFAECDASLARPFGDAWVTEIQCRFAQIDAGAAVLTPWPEVKRRGRQEPEGCLSGC